MALQARHMQRGAQRLGFVAVTCSTTVVVVESCLEHRAGDGDAAALCCIMQQRIAVHIPRRTMPRPPQRGKRIVCTKLCCVMHCSATVGIARRCICPRFQQQLHCSYAACPQVQRRQSLVGARCARCAFGKQFSKQLNVAALCRTVQRRPSCDVDRVKPFGRGGQQRQHFGLVRGLNGEVEGGGPLLAWCVWAHTTDAKVDHPI